MRTGSGGRACGHPRCSQLSGNGPLQRPSRCLRRFRNSFLSSSCCSSWRTAPSFSPQSFHFPAQHCSALQLRHKGGRYPQVCISAPRPRRVGLRAGGHGWRRPFLSSFTTGCSAGRGGVGREAPRELRRDRAAVASGTALLGYLCTQLWLQTPSISVPGSRGLAPADQGANTGSRAQSRRPAVSTSTQGPQTRGPGSVREALQQQAGTGRHKGPRAPRRGLEGRASCSRPARSSAAWKSATPGR